MKIPKAVQRDIDAQWRQTEYGGAGAAVLTLVDALGPALYSIAESLNTIALNTLPKNQSPRVDLGGQEEDAVAP